MSDHSRAPYPGLRAFKREETDLFFGRKDSTQALVRRLAATRFLAVVGASGTGKSSLVNTGLIEALELGFLADAGSRWRIVSIRPENDPLGNLARHLLADRASMARDETKKNVDELEVRLLRERLKNTRGALVDWCNANYATAGANLLVLVDQFEELFRYQAFARREEAETFVARLLECRQIRKTDSDPAPVAPVYVTLTMRSEYLGACSLIPGLAQAITDGMFLTPRMERKECEEAIVGPAEVCGVEIESALVTRLLNDMADFAPWGEQSESKDQWNRLARQADQLPLMQYALNQMWRRARTAGRPGEKVVLKLADYLGLETELDSHGEQVFRTMLSPSAQAAAETVFRTVTSGTTVANASRRPTMYGELVKICGEGNRVAVHEVVEKFSSGDCQFLTPDITQIAENALGDQWIDISHESLIRQWQRLSRWLVDEGQTAHDWQQLDEQAYKYLAGHKTRFSRLRGLLRGVGLLSGWQVSAWKSNARRMLFRPGEDPSVPPRRWLPGPRLRSGLMIATALCSGKADNPMTAWAARYGINLGKAKTLLYWSFARRAVFRTIWVGLIAVLAGATAFAMWEETRARRSLAMMAEIARSLVYNIGQDPYVQTLPHDTLAQLFNQAIQGYNQLIYLAPTAEFYNARGLAYRYMGDLDGAIADFTQAISLDSNFAGAYLDRGNVYRLKGDYPHAIADYDRLVQLDPKNAWYYYNRGVADVYAGTLTPALTDLTQSAKFDPTSAYTVIWLAIVSKRSNQPSQIAEAAKQVDMRKWPAQVIKMFLGDLTPDQVLAAAADPGEACEANFYIGEMDLGQHVTDDATRKFLIAATDCPRGYVEWASAKAELRALGINPD